MRPSSPRHPRPPAAALPAPQIRGIQGRSRAWRYRRGLGYTWPVGSRPDLPCITVRSRMVGEVFDDRPVRVARRPATCVSIRCERRLKSAARGVHRPDGRMGHVAVAPRVEVGAPHHHHTVEQVEQPDDVVLVRQRGQDHRDAARGRDAVEVAGGHDRQGGVLLAGSAVVRVDADEGLGCHRGPPDAAGPILRRVIHGGPGRVVATAADVARSSGKVTKLSMLWPPGWGDHKMRC